MQIDPRWAETIRERYFYLTWHLLLPFNFLFSLAFRGAHQAMVLHFVISWQKSIQTFAVSALAGQNSAKGPLTLTLTLTLPLTLTLTLTLHTGRQDW